jgi:tetratricopeptide (TPR) repeat protein
VAARLAAAERGILEAAAVLGSPFDPTLLAEVAEEDRESLRRRLARLAVRGVIVRTPGGTFRFRHDLLREALYQGMGDEARVVLHGRAARALAKMPRASTDPAVLAATADHYARAGETGAAIACLERSAEALVAASAPRAALERYLEAARLAETSDDGSRAAAGRRINIALQIGLLAAPALRVEEGERQLELALRLAREQNDAGAETRALLRRGQLRLHAGRFAEAVADLETVRARAEAQPRPDLVQLGQIYGALGDAHERNGDLRLAVEYLERALNTASERSALGEAGRYLAALGRASAKLGEPGRAGVHVQEALDLAAQRNDDGLRLRAMSARGISELMQGDYAGALKSFREAFDAARTLDDGDEMAIQEHNMGDMYLRLGNHARAYAHLRASYEVAAAAEWDWMLWINLMYLGYLDALRGDMESGIAGIEKALARAAELGYVQDLMQGHRLLGDLYRRKGWHAQAREHLRHALDAARQMHWVPAITELEHELAQ